MDNKVMVSICCLTFNHERYIRKALEGFVNQKTNFNYEVLIHDDCSTDGTVKVIKEYEKRYPKLIKPIYQQENQFSKGIRVSFTYQFPRAKGKYIAMCEGDDFWTDQNKLQLQFNAMEKNRNCSFCSHIVQHINEKGDFINRIEPMKDIEEEFNEGVIVKEVFFKKIISKSIIPFQTSSFFFKRDNIIECSNTFLKNINSIKDFEDVPLLWFILLKGDCYFIKRNMSNYRENSISSWSNKFKENDYKIKHYNEVIKFLDIFNSFSEYIYNIQIEKLIKNYEFYILILKEDYKKIIQKKYRENFNLFPLKNRIKIYIYNYFPFIKNIIKKLK